MSLRLNLVAYNVGVRVMKIVKAVGRPRFICEGVVSIDKVKGEWVLDLDYKLTPKRPDQLIPCESLEQAFSTAEGYTDFLNEGLEEVFE